MCDILSRRDNIGIFHNNGFPLKYDMTLHFIKKNSSRSLQTPYTMILFGLCQNLIGLKKKKNTNERED